MTPTGNTLGSAYSSSWYQSVPLPAEHYGDSCMSQACSAQLRFPMRLLSVRLIVSLIVGITLVSLGFSYYEVVREKRALRSDLERRAEVIGESVASDVEKSWVEKPRVEKSRVEKSRESGSERGLQRLVQRFGNREHLLGVAVYDREGKLVALTPELSEILTATPHNVAQVIAQNSGVGFFGRLGNDAVHILVLPLHHEDNTVGVLVVVHDVSYIRAQTLRAWREAFLRVLVQMFLIVFITLLIVRWSIAGPLSTWTLRLPAGGPRFPPRCAPD